MPFDISEKPVISKRQLNDSTFSITIDAQTKKISISATLEDEYNSGAITRTRIPPILLRDGRDGDAKYTNALNRLLPTAPKDPWTNPRETFINLAMQILSEEIV
jgi:hypothetical protein